MQLKHIDCKKIVLTALEIIQIQEIPAPALIKFATMAREDSF